MKKIAILGECMIELNGAPFGDMHQTYGGDTLNAAVYAARSSKQNQHISYVTALGCDNLSKGMIERWQQENIDTSLVLTDPKRTVGAYLIQLDAQGERTFMYWRANSPASQIVKHPEFAQVMQTIEQQYDMLFLSGISLAILSDDDRTALIEAIGNCRKSGVEIAFDSNFRPALWGDDLTKVRSHYAHMLENVDLALVTFDDEALIWGDQSPQETMNRLKSYDISNIVIKLGEQGCLVGGAGEQNTQAIPTTPVENVVDTTSAGDSFNGAFMAAYLAGEPVERACQKGNALAGIVIQHRGAIIDPESMAMLV